MLILITTTRTYFENNILICNGIYILFLNEQFFFEIFKLRNFWFSLFYDKFYIYFLYTASNPYLHYTPKIIDVQFTIDGYKLS